MKYPLFISCSKGLEYLLEEEVKALGLVVTRVNPQGVYGDATLSTLYQLCLWSKIANRIQLVLFSAQVINEQSIYQLCSQFHWQTVFTPEKTFAIEFHGGSEEIRHTLFGAQLVKDGIVDHFRKVHGQRPSVDKEQPQIRLHAHLKKDRLTLSLDLCGYSLHQRGYRKEAGLAPLKENIAAAMLLRAKWPILLTEGYGLHDPFCGSGTLVIEAAMMAASIAPGLLREDQTLVHWASHEASLWDKLRADALLQIKSPQIHILGTDSNPELIAMAKANAERAGVSQLIDFKTLPLKDCRAPTEKGLFICNPPYGERISEANSLIPLYQEIGQILDQSYRSWQAFVLTSNPLLAKAIGLRSKKQYTLYNGPLECTLYGFLLSEDNKLKGANAKVLSASAEMLKNRLKKNYDHLQKWAKKNDISCYRLYDADLPEYAYAIDIYQDYAVLQEYKAPATIPEHKVQKRSLEILQVLPLVLPIPASHLIVKQRKSQKGSSQYQKQAATQHALIVREGRAKLKVNLYDYLDTGLFLDHRLLRLQFEHLAPKTRFLNCFCYTATASVHAALAGAFTTNVDLSKTYLHWAEDNFKLNQLDCSRHQFIAYDCREWLRLTRDRFDVIFLDPPSFSNSKRMQEALDVQRDHVALIQAAMRLLNPDGVLYFSTNLRSFKLDERVKERYGVTDLSQQTIDVDFKRDLKVHQCFRVVMRAFA